MKLKKLIGYILVIIGFLCFLIVVGGSMRYRNYHSIHSISIVDGLSIIGFIILIPVIGYFLAKFGFKLIGEDKE